MPNLGLVIVPSEDVLNHTDSELLEDLSIMTHRLVSDLSVVGDMYAKETDIVHDFSVQKGTSHRNRRKGPGSGWSNPVSELDKGDDDLAPEKGHWNLNFTPVANCVLPVTPISESTPPQVSLQHLRTQILDKIANDSRFETL